MLLLESVSQSKKGSEKVGRRIESLYKQVNGNERVESMWVESTGKQVASAFFATRSRDMSYL
jgi:hypothetical protein